MQMDPTERCLRECEFILSGLESYLNSIELFGEDEPDIEEEYAMEADNIINSVSDDIAMEALNNQKKKPWKWTPWSELGEKRATLDNKDWNDIRNKLDQIYDKSEASKNSTSENEKKRLDGEVANLKKDAVNKYKQAKQRAASNPQTNQNPNPQTTQNPNPNPNPQQSNDNSTNSNDQQSNTNQNSDEDKDIESRYPIKEEQDYSKKVDRSYVIKKIIEDVGLKSGISNVIKNEKSLGHDVSKLEARHKKMIEEKNKRIKNWEKAREQADPNFKAEDNKTDDGEGKEENGEDSSKEDNSKKEKKEEAVRAAKKSIFESIANWFKKIFGITNTNDIPDDAQAEVKLEAGSKDPNDFMQFVFSEFNKIIRENNKPDPDKSKIMDMINEFNKHADSYRKSWKKSGTKGYSNEQVFTIRAKELNGGIKNLLGTKMAATGMEMEILNELTKGIGDIQKLVRLSKTSDNLRNKGDNKEDIRKDVNKMGNRTLRDAKRHYNDIQKQRSAGEILT